MVWLLLIPLFVFAQVIRVDQQLAQRLDIKTQKVRVENVSPEIRMPAQLKVDMSRGVEVHSPLEGVIKRMYVKEGDIVKKGQPLAEVYSPRVAELNAQLRLAQVRLQTAEDALKREELLYKEEVIPYARYYAAKVEYDKALAEYRALLQSRNSLGEIKGEDLLIRSPGYGVVVEQKAMLGSSVGLGSLLFRIQDYSKLWAYAYAAPGLKPEGRGFFEYDGKLYPASLEWTSPRLDPATGMQVLRFLVDNSDGKLKEGLKAHVVIKGKEQKGVWLPAVAVQRVRGQEVVFVKVREGFELRKVKALFTSGDKVLLDGISEGEEVAVGGVIFLKAQAEK